MISLCNWTFHLLSNRLLQLLEAESQALVGPELKKPAGQKAKRLLEIERVQLHRKINTWITRTWTENLHRLHLTTCLQS